MTFLDLFYAVALVLTVVWVATVLAVATYDHNYVMGKLRGLKVARRLQRRSDTGTKSCCSDCIGHNHIRE